MALSVVLLRANVVWILAIHPILQTRYLSSFTCLEVSEYSELAKMWYGYGRADHMGSMALKQGSALLRKRNWNFAFPSTV